MLFVETYFHIRSVPNFVYLKILNSISLYLCFVKLLNRKLDFLNIYSLEIYYFEPLL